MTTEYKKPVPRPLHPELTKPFWEAAKRHELLIPRCKICSKYFWYPREECPYCLRQGWDWHVATGKGRLYTYTVVHRAADPRFQAQVPYVYAVIQLDEGPRLISNVVDCDVGDVTIDMPVTVHFDDVTDETTLVKFRPA